VFLFQGFGAIGWLWGEFAGYLATFVVLWPLAFSDLRLVNDPTLTPAMMRFGAALTPSLFSHWVMVGADRFVMLATLPDARQSIGLYAVGERISTIIHLVNAAFTLGWQRFAFENLQRPDGPERLARGITLYGLVGGYATLGLSLLGDDLTHWVMPSAYDGGMQVIPALTLAGFLAGFAELVSVGMQQAGQAARLSILTSIAAALQVGLLLVLIPRFGILGAAYASLACQALKAGLVWRASHRAIPMPWEFRRLGLLAFIFTGAFLLGQLFVPFGWTTATLGQSAIVLVVPAIVYFGGFLDSDEKARLLAGFLRLVQPKLERELGPREERP
jgi:O-antigen/teichoic acid export membrane protein